MEESIKYFQPDISDIRVGYECECLWQRPEPKTWDKIEVTETDTEEYLKLSVEEVIRRVKSNEIRVPYLTKEQIEAEGWRCIHWREYLWEKGNKTIHFFNGQKEDNDDSTYLSIFTIHNSSKVLFEGECKDINIFRYICKLLNIK